jgi:hypothetical protein
MIMCAAVKLFLFSFCSLAQQTSFRIINAINQEPIAHCQFEWNISTSKPAHIVCADSSGVFKIEHDSISDKSIWLHFDMAGYLPKDVVFDTIEMKLQETIKLRPRGVPDVPTSNIDTSFFGMRLKKVVKMFKLDPTDYFIIHEPGRMARGISFHQPDGSFVSFYIEKTVHLKNDHQVFRERITGFGLMDPGCTNPRVMGEGVPWFGIIGCD